MSEKKRFYKFLDDKQEWVIRDRTNRRQEYRVGRNKRYTEKLVDLLNDQQPIINKLKEENEQLKQEHKIAIDEMITDYKNLKKENEQLRKENFFLDYWKRKAMILLMQVRRLTPRMTDKEVIEFSKELDDE